LGLIVALTVTGTAAPAIDFDFSGNFELDNDVALVGFTVGAPGDVTLFTSSWIAGDPPPGGELYGFDPVVSVWGFDGGLLATKDDGLVEGTAYSNGVLYTYGLYDAYFDVFLAAGDYQVTVTQSNNYPVRPNLSDGFTQDGNPDFTSGWGPQDHFNGLWNPPDPRSSKWELHVVNVAPVETVPEPSTWLVLGIGGLAIARLRRRR
jgi:hypothetical protein